MDYSQLLKQVVNTAGGISDNRPMTIEKILCVLISHIHRSEDGSFAAFKRFMARFNVDAQTLVKAFDAHIQSCNCTPLDGKYLERILSYAEEYSQQNNIPVVLANAVLWFALENCNSALELIFAQSGISLSKENISAFKPADILSDSLEYEARPTITNETDTSAQQPARKIVIEGAATPETLPKAENEKAPDKTETSIAKLIAETKKIQDVLLSSVFGQDNAVSVFATGYFQSQLLAITDKKRQKPAATFLFAGPPGVGKTFLAEKIAETLNLPFLRADMSEYSTADAAVEFCGSDNVYKNGKCGNITGFVEKNPRCVLLFDEIEKAHISAIHLFLQMLDAGRLRDNFTDNEVSFKDAIIIITTNAGRTIYKETDATDFSGLSRKIILKSLGNDINPSTGTPYFPAALCSRFASGNVVMFNHITAHNLRSIAKREVLRHAENFKREMGINVEIDELVHTALLLAEGATADARTVRGRAEAFFDDELYELFRLVDGTACSIDKIRTIKFSVNLPESDSEIVSLFKNTECSNIVLFSKNTEKYTDLQSQLFNITAFSEVDKAAKHIKENDVKMVFVDLMSGVCEAELDYLNIEDAQSDARDFMKWMLEAFAEIPVYLIESAERKYSVEEKFSFIRQGVRSTVDFSDPSNVKQTVEKLCGIIHQQDSMNALAKANKLVSYNTSQRLVEDSTVAEIGLFDFQLKVAVDAEDSGNILSNVSKPDVKFDQVIGADDAKEELKYFVEYLKNPKKFIGTGVQPPKGVILYGPPGTGKTMLAKAMASESGVTFISAEGNEFLKKYVGEGQERVHELFKIARKYAPSVLFIDEIDAIAKERKGGDNSSGAEATLTAFLTEMDGFKKDPKKPVFVLAATNFDVEPGSSKSLDPALMRRFDRRLYIDLPDRKAREKYLDMKIGKNKLFNISQEMKDNIAMRSAGMSPAQLESVAELALRMALRTGKTSVTDDVLEEAFETFNSGEEKHWDISQLERTARHEAGHAFLCWHSGETPSYLTIVARSNHGGYMQHADNEGKALYTKDELLAKIRTSLGGRASEIVYYGEREGLSTGASGDLNSATNIAKHIVCSYGMDEKFGLATCNEAVMSDAVRDAVNSILSEEMKKAILIITENKNRIDRLVTYLLEKNHMTGDEISSILSE